MRCRTAGLVGGCAGLLGLRATVGGFSTGLAAVGLAALVTPFGLAECVPLPLLPLNGLSATFAFPLRVADFGVTALEGVNLLRTLALLSAFGSGFDAEPGLESLAVGNAFELATPFFEEATDFALDDTFFLTSALLLIAFADGLRVVLEGTREAGPTDFFAFLVALGIFRLAVFFAAVGLDIVFLAAPFGETLDEVDFFIFTIAATSWSLLSALQPDTPRRLAVFAKSLLV